MENLSKKNIFRIPSMGEGLKELQLVAWQKKSGDWVEEGEVFLSVATDKVQTDLSSPYTGYLMILKGQEGDKLKIGEIVANFSQDKDDASLPNLPLQIQTSEIHAVASQKKEYLYRKIKVLSSPLAKKLAKKWGVPLEHIPGRGFHGRILKKDLEIYLKTRDVSQPYRVPVSSMRRALAQKMEASVFIPQATTTFAMDVSQVQQFRQLHPLSYTTFFLAACATALKKVPILNASWEGESLAYYEDISIGLAVALPSGGVLLPVLSLDPLPPLLTLGKALQDMLSRVRRGILLPQEQETPTRLSITNPGIWGSYHSQPLLPPGQTGIVSLGAVSRSGLCQVGLTFDHRVLDGQEACSFLEAVQNFLCGVFVP